MQNVSTAWKSAQRQILVPESEVEIKLSVTDPEAAANATASDNGHHYISDTASIVKEVENDPVKYSMLERNLWVLGGGCVILPDEPPYGKNGYVGSVLCNENAVFTDPPSITISFSKTFTAVIPGLSIDWGVAYGDYANLFRVTVYVDNVAVSVNEVENDSEKTVWAHDIEEYDKIVIEVLRWSKPRHRARISKLRLGMEKIYRKNDLMSYTHSLRVNPLSAELPKSEIKFYVKNLNGEYNPYNPTGTERYMMQRQMLLVRYGYKLGDDVEWIKAGTFYLNGWDMPQNGIQAGFTARDILENLSGKYTGSTSGTLGDIIRRAMTQAQLPLMSDGTVRWQIDSSLDSISVPSGINLSENTMAEVIQYAANAGCCVMVPDRDGRLIVSPLSPAPNTSDYPIDLYVGYSNADLALEKPIKTINVNNGQYVLNVNPVGEDEPITNPLISDSRAPVVAQWTANLLTKRNILSGSWRADPRLDPMDRIENENQFGTRIALVTEIEYQYNGAFRGNYKAREGA